MNCLRKYLRLKKLSYSHRLHMVTNGHMWSQMVMYGHKQLFRYWLFITITIYSDHL